MPSDAEGFEKIRYYRLFPISVGRSQHAKRLAYEAERAPCTRPLFIQISFEEVRGWPGMTTFPILAGGCGCLTLVTEGMKMVIICSSGSEWVFLKGGKKIALMPRHFRSMLSYSLSSVVAAVNYS